MNSELVRALWRRSEIYLREARRLYEEGYYDVALVMAEQAVQLGIKAVYSRVLGYAPRGHSLRRLLGYLASVLEENEQHGEARAIRDFVVEYRDVLVLLEDAYTEGRYALPGYTRTEAERGITVAEKLLSLLKQMFLSGEEVGKEDRRTDG
ncbi:HEPN domain-containing protein [Pyrofollis japonicus]|uniref:HEPN domain-containing protein n=1 Tax=Pyrofollis japonicus TaxID=3060460 RepID=UPI00295BBCE4|nr:HEPN domain-containing protein [Pyrofollis japonicus]BEP16699.1 HEPN domain-containing protein [Pyrofollis japonicus]